MENSNTQTTPVVEKKKKSFSIKGCVFKLFLIALLVFVAWGYWKYFYTYSDGYRSGLLQKFSNKGNVFKTYEGEITQIGGTNLTNMQYPNKDFVFSVADKNVAKQMEQLEGLYLRVHYVQKNGTLPWRGETEYIVDSVCNVFQTRDNFNNYNNNQPNNVNYNGNNLVPANGANTQPQSVPVAQPQTTTPQGNGVEYIYQDNTVKILVTLYSNSWVQKIVTKTTFGDAYDEQHASVSQGTVSGDDLKNQANQTIGTKVGDNVNLTVGEKTIMLFKK